MTESPAVEQRHEETRVLKSPDWIVTENIFGGLGAGILCYCWPRLIGGEWGHLPECAAAAGITAGALCLVRFGIDEIALLLRVTFTQALIAGKRAGDWGGRQQVLRDLRIVIAHADNLEKENAQLRARVALLEKKQPSGFVTPRTETKAEREAAERRMHEQQQWFDSQVDAFRAQDAERAAPAEEPDDIAPTLQLDESVEQEFAAARELLNHYEQFESLAKENARQNSGINKRQWAKARDCLIDAGAARLDDGRLDLVVSVYEADVLLDSYREKLARQLHG